MTICQTTDAISEWVKLHSSANNSPSIAKQTIMVLKIGACDCGEFCISSVQRLTGYGPTPAIAIPAIKPLLRENQRPGKSIAMDLMRSTFDEIAMASAVPA